MKQAVLYLICGKIAAGKSTLAAELARRPVTVLISEDIWLSRLYPNEIKTLEDYVQRSKCLRDVIEGHVADLLAAGVSVVLDFPANTDRLRKWMRGISDGQGVSHELHYLDVPEALCKSRLKTRNESGTHEFEVTEAQFDQFTSYFMPPMPEEGLTVIVHDGHDEV